jgi:rhomboid protease GluP
MTQGVRSASAFPWITAAVSAACLLLHAVAASGVSLVWVTGGDPYDTANPVHLVGLGARCTALVADAGQGVRLLTSALVHTSWLHVGFNVAFLFPVGGALEQVVGRRSHAALLLVCAAAAGLASLVGTPQVSAGASGLVFGVLAAAVCLGLRHGDRLGPRVRPYFGLWVLPFLLVVLGVSLSNDTVDHASHLGGVVAGGIVGFGLPLRGDDRRDGTRLGLAAIGCIAAVAIAPWLARRGHAPIVHEVQDTAAVALPASWAPRYGPLGELEFVTAGGMVALDLEVGPDGPPRDQRAWYARHRIAPMIPSGRLRDVRQVAIDSVRTTAVEGHRIRYRLRRDRTPMIRDVYFLGASTGGSATIVLTLEMPATWAAAYAPTEARIVASIRPPAPQTLDDRLGSTLSPAALH